MLAALSMFAAPGSATVYKCVDASGKLAYMDKPCPRGAVESTVALPDESGLSSEDREWLARSRPAMESTCAQGLTTASGEDPQAGMTPEAIARVCECAARRYFSATPITRLRALEEAQDAQGTQALLKAAMAVCTGQGFGPE